MQISSIIYQRLLLASLLCCGVELMAFDTTGKACGQVQLAYELEASESPLPVEAIHYKTYCDRDKPPVVLIHGLTSGSYTWASVIPRLRHDYFLVVYDQRGHGKTAEAGTVYSNTTMARDLLALLDHLALERVDLIGHSLGGRTAMKFAALFPERTRRVLVEDMHIDSNGTATQADYAIAERLRAIRETFPSREAAARELKAIYPAHYHEYADYLANEKLIQLSEGVYAFRFKPHAAEYWELYGLYEDLGPTLAKVTPRILFLRAEDINDQAILTTAKARRIQELRPDIEIKEIKGADHTIHESQRDRFLEEVSSFLSGSD